MITIDYEVYDVNIISLKRKGDFLDKYARRTVDGELHREIIGVYFNYELTFGTPRGTTQIADYKRLWTKLTEATEFHRVVVPDEDGDYEFWAYFSNVKDELKRQHDGVNRWKGLTANFIARSPAVK